MRRTCGRLRCRVAHANWLLCAGMNMLNISVDTLRPERFEQMTRRRGHERVMDAIHNAIRLGYDPVKVIFLTPAQGVSKVLRASACVLWLHSLAQ